MARSELPWLLRACVSFLPRCHGSLELRRLSHWLPRMALPWLGAVLVDALSFVVFLALDALDRLLCVVFRIIDSALDPDPARCYCSRPPSPCLNEENGNDNSNSAFPRTKSTPDSEKLSAHVLYRPSFTLYGRKHIHVSKQRGFKSGTECVYPCTVTTAGDPLPTNRCNEHGCPGHGSVLRKSVSHGDGSPWCATDLRTSNIEQRWPACPSIFNRFSVRFSACFGRLKIQQLGGILNRFSVKFPDSVGTLKIQNFSSVTSQCKVLTIRNSPNKATFLRSKWSDCGCTSCNSWHSRGKKLHVQIEEHKYLTPVQDACDNVIFIHGFLSSSSMWTEKVVPYLLKSTRMSYNLYPVDLLGFGKSPKPRDCFYTMADHLESIETSVLEQYKIKSFNLVAHSMGCIVALALAAAHKDAVKTITLVAPPYFPAPLHEPAAAHVLKQVAPRKIWPLVSFGASVMSWYEHVGRGVCFVICKHHRLWEPVVKVLTLNRISSSSIHDFMQHTHHSAWHIFHNVICGEAHALDGYLSTLETANCKISVFHGREDTVVPVNCSFELQKRHKMVKVNIVDRANHFTIIFGREKIFTHMLDSIWRGGQLSDN